jgi:RecB family exonuclease/inactivated superfamily I helicase
MKRRARGDRGEGLLPFDLAPKPPAAAGTPRRVFLGWDGPALARAAEWILRERGADLEGLFLALPGSRSVRRLSELLALRAPRGWKPPRILTQGALVDAFVELERPAAGRLERTLAWQRALEGLAPASLARLSPRAADKDGGAARLALAETLRELHGKLAPEGVDFERVARAAVWPDDGAERERWRVLAEAQARWRAVLAACELSDPHESRRAALEAGKLCATGEVVLVGVADMNGLLATLLERLGERATALVVAPEEHAEGFDALGRFVPAYWSAQHVPLDERTWFVEEKPADQADRVEALLGEWCEECPAEALTIGLADEEVAPYLERRLAAAGARLRVAAGTPLARTRPFKLLGAVAALLERGSFAELAALARHPDAAPQLAASGDPAEILDRYHAVHLPARAFPAGGDWPGDEEESRGVRQLARGVDHLLGGMGPLAKGGAARAELAVWARETRALCLRVYGTRPLDPKVEDERVLALSLGEIGAALEELETLPASLAGGALPAHEALRLVLRAVRDASVAPAPARADEPTVEALGWLELALDDAPALVVTGFNEGRVPQSIQGDAFLPDGLRARLGLADNEARLARDLYATRVLLATRQRAAFVTGRRAKSGDPLVPSRIALAAPPEELARRVRIFLPPPARIEPVPASEEPALPAALPRWHAESAPDTFAVTSFRTFLRSPYRFYLERVLKLRSVDDRARELDPLRFGELAHGVLQAFGEGPARDASDARAIEEALLGELERRVRAVFGPAPLPAVALQIEQLRYRLRQVAEVQSERRRAGWRIQKTELAVEDFPFEVDGRPALLRGRIDRIDLHADGERWAILDYKTGDAAAAPEAAARGAQGWKDLQLPLYRLMAEPFARAHGLEREPELGFFQVGKDEDDVGLFLVEEWSAADHAEALEVARSIVRRVRAGDWHERGPYAPFEEEHILCAIFGMGLLAPARRAAEAGA